VFPVVYGLLAINDVVEGVQHGQARILHFAIAAVFVALAVLWVLVVPRSLARQPARMERLRTQVNDRYGPVSIV
jgi:cytochrome bd-type quinol oxidase subunit 1